MDEIQIEAMGRLVLAECLIAYMAGAMKMMYGLVQDEPTKAAIADIIVRIDGYNEGEQ